ncbi:FAD-dependent oxidoreductase [Cryptosporangium aurantiacum]|uniref:2-polyprenyl-6-methoxyphenol hydroxylase n=1 Tax=Cryptosporangium aurantiacum TaxID=134849 RepID=A0A1M7RMI8_9ACTN|nr:NAD(P)/FAD-dependent oxidoreductase [Cryptosporangium aurantiacum]SHN47312.1 2-polyprenyl-6-methoxyphenol hydroxylase [Cryptosporangium aurantiacum]
MGTTDCIVVGAGPTGLMTALLLGRSGHSVLVLERQPTPLPPPGGVVLQPATLGLFDQFGTLPMLEAVGSRIAGVDEITGGGVTYAPDYADLPDVAVPYALTVPLRVLRDVLGGMVAAQDGVRVEFGAEVTAIDQDAAGCVVHSGTARRTRYVIGADGKYSTVRTVAGFVADVRPLPRRQLILRAPRPDGWPDRIRSHRGDRPFVVIPSTPETIHVFGDVVAAEPAAALEELCRAVAPTAPELSRLLRSSADPVALIRHHLVTVERWVRDRVALLGDSAHSVHPYGGQGINLGLQDAVLLCRALDRCLDPERPDPAAPAEYEALRRPFVETFQRYQETLLSTEPGDSPLYRTAFAELALGQPELRPLLRAATAPG